MQHGNAECGVFAVAFATALCSGKDPTEIQQLRANLKKCLLEDTVKEFLIYKEKNKMWEN